MNFNWTSMLLMIVVVVVLIVMYGYYTGLVGKKNQALEALAGIDVQLTARADSIPNVLKIARRFMEHESKLITEITALRTSVTSPYDARKPGQVREHLDAAAQLDGKVGQLVATLEAYPELKSDAVMLQAQRSYSDIEAHIAAARRFYNTAVGDLNTAVEIFPGNLIANMAGIEPMPFYQAPAASRHAIDADAYLA